MNRDCSDDTTLPLERQNPTAKPGAGVLCLTIVFHPDPARIGQNVRVEMPRAGRALSIGRSEPVFAHPGEGAGLALLDPHVSREAFTLSVRRGRWLLAIPPNSSTLRTPAGRVEGELPLSTEQMEQGLSLTLGERVLLHLRVIPHDHAVATHSFRNHGELLGNSPAMAVLREAIQRFAEAGGDVLLRGESGTGKELVARALHRQGVRSTGPFIAVNIAAVPEELAAAALFGVVRGAYTGADSARPGYFREAAGGSLFLDEIGDVAPVVQPQLLRALQEREIQVVGGATQSVDLTVISATDAALDEGANFRTALRHRLGQLELCLPPLRERREDIGTLLFHFLAPEAPRPGPDASAEDICLWLTLMEHFMAYAWPGNVRELRNVAQRLTLGTVRDFVTIRQSLDLSVAAGKAGSDTPPRASQPIRSMSEYSNGQVQEALEQANWNVSEAARHLAVSRQALYRRLETLPNQRRAEDIPRQELERALRLADGDVSRAARELRISPAAMQRGLRRRNQPI